MGKSMSKLIGSEVAAIDGDIGKVSDLYFDDERWVVRYLICDTDKWTSRRQVLVSPISIRNADSVDGHIYVNLSQVAVATSPDISLKEPVSRRLELEYAKHYQFPVYWVGGGLWGGAMDPIVLAKNTITDEEEQRAITENIDSSHLRSTLEVTGYHVHADDGSVGHIEDFLLDDESWAIRHVVVDTRNWLPGKKVLLAPRRINEIKWSESSVVIHMPKAAIEASPELN